MAKPIPSTVSVDIFIELIPTTCPAILIKGPPEFPGLIAASVCIAVISQSYSPSPSVSTGTVLPIPEIIPDVTDEAKSVPKGEPIAIAGSPTVKFSEYPNSTTVFTFEFGDSENLTVGEPAIAIGSPLGTDLEPIAIAGSPTVKFSESPNSTTVSTFEASTERTAKSVHTSVPSTSASTRVPSCNRTWIASEPSTT